MPDQTKSHITLILDRSGSMASIQNDVIGAVNRFIDDQKSVPGACSFTLIQFDDKDPYEKIYEGPLADAKHLTAETYKPRGNTPLLDAVGKGIVDLDVKLAAIPEADRPGKVVFVVQTDGQENASHEWTDRKKLAEMVKTQTDTYKWQFVFLGANQDAILAGGSLSMAAGTSLSYANTSRGTQNALHASSVNVASYRGTATMDFVPDYTDAQRAAAMAP